MSHLVKNLLVLIGLIQLIVTFTPITQWWARALTGPWPDENGEILIVLGGEQVEGGMLGRASYWRAAHAATLWKAGRVRKLFLSGGGGHGEPSVAAQMKQFLEVAGVAADAIRVEEKSLTTRGNALAASEELKDVPGRKLLLTSDFHMFRSTRVFRQAGLDVTPCPAPDANKQYLALTERWSLAIRLAEETGKLAYYAARGWL